MLTHENKSNYYYIFLQFRARIVYISTTQNKQYFALRVIWVVFGLDLVLQGCIPLPLF